MKKRKLLTVFASIAAAATFTCGLASCGNTNDSGNAATRDPKIFALYTQYAAVAENNGEQPLTYEEWLETIKGIDGTDGKDGVTPTFKLEEGVLFVSYDNGTTWNRLGEVSTGETSGKDGKDGNDGANGKSAYEIWKENGQDRKSVV